MIKARKEQITKNIQEAIFESKELIKLYESEGNYKMSTRYLSIRTELENILTKIKKGDELKWVRKK